MPIIDLAHRNLITSRALGGGGKDWSSLIAGPRVAGGLDAFTGVSSIPFWRLRRMKLVLDWANGDMTRKRC